MRGDLNETFKMMKFLIMVDIFSIFLFEQEICYIFWVFFFAVSLYHKQKYDKKKQFIFYLRQFAKVYINWWNI